MTEKISGFVKPDNINQKTIRLDYLEMFKNYIKSGDVYQFGVYSGVSIRNILCKYRQFNLINNVWGFDSFCGLPLETKENIAYEVWNEGEFSSCDYLDVNNPVEAANILKNQIQKEYPEYSLEMIVGFYNETLKACDVSKMKPASWVDIDVDLYSSTIDVLEFMITNKLIVSGTLVYCDDWKGIEFGEGRAFLEISNKYNLKSNRLIGEGEVLFQIL